MGFVCPSLDTIGVAVRPSFDLYCAGLLATLLVGFAWFSDAATREP